MRSRWVRTISTPRRPSSPRGSWPAIRARQRTWRPARSVGGGNARRRCCGRSPTASSSGTRRRATTRSVRSRTSRKAEVASGTCTRSGGRRRRTRSCSMRTRAMLDEAYAILLDARVELQRLTGRPANVLASEHQPAVASALGLSSPEELMARIAEAARTIAWTSDDAWRRLAVAAQASRGRGIRRRIGPRGEAAAGAGLRVGNAEVFVEADVDAADPAPRAPCRRHRRASRRGHRTPLARTARGGRLAVARAVGRRDAPPADRALGLRSLGGPRDRRARPAGCVGMRAPRMATGAFPAAAGRVPRLHRRPASAGDGRRRVTARAAGVSAGSPADGGAVARHRQGIRRRPCGGRRSHRRAHLRADGVRVRRHRDRRLARRAASAPPRRRHAS